MPPSLLLATPGQPPFPAHSAPVVLLLEERVDLGTVASDDQVALQSLHARAQLALRACWGVGWTGALLSEWVGGWVRGRASA